MGALMKKFRTATAALALTVLLLGCGSTDPDGEGADVVDATEPTAGDASPESTTPPPATEDEPSEAEPSEAESEAGEAAEGTRENPLPLGTRAMVGDYEIAVTEAVLDATQQNLDNNEFNEAPPEGTQYVLVSLEGKYVGEDSGDPGIDLMWKMLGPGNNTFDSLWQPDDAPDDFYPSCTLDTMYDTREVFPDGEWTGKICILMPSDQVEGSSVIIEAFSLGETDRTFWAIQ